MERKQLMSGNTELLNGYCHLVNKTVLFVQKYFEGIVPAGKLDQDLYWRTKAVYERAEGLYNCNKEEEAKALLEDFLEFANSYFESGRPWETCRNDRSACRNTVLNSLQLVANLTVLLRPVLDYPTQTVSGWLQLNEAFRMQSVHSGHELPRTALIALVDMQSECI